MDAPSLTAAREAIEGRHAVESLDGMGEELFYDLCSLLGPSPDAVRFFAERRKQGGSVGLDAQGRLVCTQPGGGVEVKEAGDLGEVD